MMTAEEIQMFPSLVHHQIKDDMNLIQRVYFMKEML